MPMPKTDPRFPYEDWTEYWLYEFVFFFGSYGFSKKEKLSHEIYR